MKQSSTSRKLNEQAREIISSILLTEVSDPRLRMVTITGTEVSMDRSVMSVYVSAPEERYDEVLAGLESAKGRIRGALGERITWRVTPELRFFIDDSVDNAARIDEALREVPPSLKDQSSEEDAD